MYRLLTGRQEQQQQKVRIQLDEPGTFYSLTGSPFRLNTQQTRDDGLIMTGYFQYMLYIKCLLRCWLKWGARAYAGSSGVDGFAKHIRLHNPVRTIHDACPPEIYCTAVAKWIIRCCGAFCRLKVRSEHEFMGCHLAGCATHRDRRVIISPPR
jgi:hypothetical protein